MQAVVDSTSGLASSDTVFLLPKFVRKSVAASQTDSSIIAAVTSKKLRVVAGIISAGDTAGSALTFESDDAVTDTVLMKFQPAANQTIVLPYNPLGYFETDSGEALILTTGAGSTTEMSFVYVEV